MTERVLQLRLPFPPSLNRIWRAVGGKIKLSAAARLYHRKVRNAVVHLPVAPITARVAVSIVLCPPERLKGKAWDIANREKSLCDALTKQKIWKDDSLIDALQLQRWTYDPDYPDGVAMVTIAWREPGEAP